MCAIWLPRVLVRKHKLLQAAALAPVVETGECEDVGASVKTRARPHMPSVRADTLASPPGVFVDKL